MSHTCSFRVVLCGGVSFLFVLRVLGVFKVARVAISGFLVLFDFLTQLSGAQCAFFSGAREAGAIIRRRRRPWRRRRQSELGAERSEA